MGGFQFPRSSSPGPVTDFEPFVVTVMIEACSDETEELVHPHLFARVVEHIDKKIGHCRVNAGLIQMRHTIPTEGLPRKRFDVLISPAKHQGGKVH